MSAMVSATSTGEGAKDWRDECVKPEKDERVQTVVSTQATLQSLINMLKIPDP